MIGRKAEKDINNWLDGNGRHALLVTGARQTGKTTLIRSVLSGRSMVFTEFNFAEKPELISRCTEAIQKGAVFFCLASATDGRASHT